MEKDGKKDVAKDEAVGEETEVDRRGCGTGREAAGQMAKAVGTRRGGRRGRGQESNRLDADGAAQHQADQEQQMAV